MAVDWNGELRAARTSRGMSREELADHSGVSVDSLRSYELGRRRPTREHLLRLLKSLRLGWQTRNRILVSAGFASEMAAEKFPEPNLGTKEAMRLVRQRPLPTFLTNTRAEILAISGAAWRLMGMRDRELDPPRRTSVLSSIVFRALAARVLNWDEIMGETIRFFKSATRDESPLDALGPALKPILREMTAGEPALMTRFMELWETTPPFRGRATGYMYPSVWSAPGGAIRFDCYVSCLNTEIGLYSHMLVPSDARSHRLLEKLLASD